MHLLSCTTPSQPNEERFPNAHHVAGLVPNTIVTEASGGITLENLASYSGTGVNNISLGFLTHSVKALDISLQVKEGNKKDI